MNEEKVDSCWMKMIFEIINQNHHQIFIVKKKEKQTFCSSGEQSFNMSIIF